MNTKSKKFKEQAENEKWITIRGYGDYYGKILTVKVLQHDQKNHGVLIETKEGVKMRFDDINGFNCDNKLGENYSGYQLDINQLKRNEMLKYQKYLDKLS